ncbi:hypothetical protein HK103_006315 [Boothiomyces macroporosus]|uniref:Protein kinase domain-containing protein n=1 Tax=Boothiomyces macroporosus TaxID=261099 RepID=A0AAD5UDP8_9FUNG|nr:hypothetical protein HK103_006315 [Boothiomyces macroporosus]
MGEDSQNIKETLDATVSEENGRRVLNQYTITKQLGSGSFGTVHLAYDADNDRKVAIKECSKSKLRKQKNQALGVFPGRGRGRGGGVGRRVTVSRPAQVAPPQNPIDLVRGEIAILKKLNHPNIVKLYEVLDDPKQDSLFMVFELCEKGAVMDVSMDKSVKPLDIKVARNYFQQLILGIEYLHEHGIAHRDIKPDNMLISKDGVVKIIDSWVTDDGKSPLITMEENCSVTLLEITQNDIDAAVKPLANLFTVLKAVSKLKNFASKKSEEN